MNPETIENSDYSSSTREYLEAVSRAVFDINERQVDEMAAVIEQAVANNRAILVGGNGGSFLTASHLAVDLEKCIQIALPMGERCYPNVPRVHVLGGNPGTWSAWVNDDVPIYSLAWQVAAWGEPNGVLLLLSASGESANLIRAARAGRANGMIVFALVGRADSSLAEESDRSVVIGTRDVQIAEDAHSVICHALFKEVLRRVKERFGAA